MKTISISKGNVKMGTISSVSLPPLKTCAVGCAGTCGKKCYARKMQRYPNVKKAYEKNYQILGEDLDGYFRQIEATCMMTTYFRYHVSGDIPTAEYFDRMVEVANRQSHCKMLAFTKQYDIINNYLDNGGIIPQNLKIVFSAWPGLPMDNRHNLPISHVIFKGEENTNNYPMCGGNCFECAITSGGCWTLGNGEHIAFNEH